MTKSSRDEQKQQLNNKVVLFLVITVVLVLSVISLLYAVSPASIRQPKFDHYHFRMQIVMEGQSINFGDSKYQVPVVSAGCDVELTEHPVHFHDNKDQFVHIHWDGMTGGLVLKNYGWNKVGGSDKTLGYRFDKGVLLQKVPIHGRMLPTVESDTKFYVYTGNETAFVQRSFEEFRDTDLESFFGRQSSLNQDQSGLLEWLFPAVKAHGNEHHLEPSTQSGMMDLEQINNLLGNVVIFVQKDKPSLEEVKERFSSLVPLSDSACAG